MDEYVLTLDEDEITVGESTFADIEKLDIGTSQIIKWGDFSYEYYFNKIGVSFTYRQGDPERVIDWISINPRKARGEISGILSLKRSLRLKDIVGAFGTGDWVYTDDSTELDIDYEYFSVEMLMDLKFLNSNLESFSSPDWETYYDFYRNKKIGAIVFY